MYCSYDVSIAPVVNVKINVENPRCPSEKDIDNIIKLAVEAIREEFTEKISVENLQSVTLYAENLEEGPLTRPVKVL